MDEDLPAFPYHPDPVGTGSVKRSGATCLCCGRARGFVYAGPVYAVEELDEALCPWCIADGSAAERFDATFTDVQACAGQVPREVVDRVLRRTPGFAAWQQEEWMCHCGDAAVFLGRVGATELAAYPVAMAGLRTEGDGRGWTPGEREAFLASLGKDAGQTAYLFRCRRCDTHLAYSDSA
jgi:uncharacterized protein CbrC (UPF0167 family)